MRSTYESFFESPQADFGYDVSDYYAIAPEYGTRVWYEDGLIRSVLTDRVPSGSSYTPPPASSFGSRLRRPSACRSRCDWPSIA
jgi:hypothetical protein